MIMYLLFPDAMTNEPLVHENETTMCEHCGKDRPRSDRKHHGRGKCVDQVNENLPCDECGKTFAHKASLKAHAKTHIFSPGQCRYCSKMLSSAHALKVERAILFSA